MYVITDMLILSWCFWHLGLYNSRSPILDLAAVELVFNFDTAVKLVFYFNTIEDKTTVELHCSVENTKKKTPALLRLG